MFDNFIVVIFVIIIGLPIFFLPSIIAVLKNHPYKMPIIIINILSLIMWFFSFIVWIALLIWSFVLPKEDDNAHNKIKISDVANEIEKLHSLKEKGVITQKEFDDKKGLLLKG